MDNEKLKACALAAHDLLRCRAVIVIAVDDRNVSPIVVLDPKRNSAADVKYALTVALGALRVSLRSTGGDPNGGARS